MQNQEETQSSENLELKTSEKRNSLNDVIQIKLKDQDFMQRMNVCFTLIFEIYRVCMGAFLLLFVPQKCNDDLCNMFEHFNSDSDFIKGVLSCNGITLLFFFFLYGIEVKREHKLIHYLEVTRTKPVDNDSVGLELENIEKSKIESIWKLDKYYYNMGMGALLVYLVNSALSGYVIYNHVYDSKTYTVFLTNVLFMGLKVYDVYDIVNTKKNVFYSAYIKARTQFNDVDPEKRIENNEKLDIVQA